MLSESHSVNTSIKSCATHLLQQEESQSQSEKNTLCERALKLRLCRLVKGEIVCGTCHD